MYREVSDRGLFQRFAKPRLHKSPVGSNPTTSAEIMKLLLYGFGSWGKTKQNISREVVDAIEVEKWPELEIEKRVFKVRFEAEPFLEAAGRIRPDYILGLGQYSKGRVMRIERRAMNEIQEKGGVRPIDVGGEEYRKVNWLIEPGEGVEVKDDAGRFVCNFSMYTLMGWADTHHCRYGFIHIPRVVGVTKARVMVEKTITSLSGRGRGA